MRLFAIGFVILATVAPAAAQQRKFPYEAVVDADETRVRSGPGRKYYPTSELSRGSRVIVHRHDPGPWYMIAVPKGSFSWIRAEYVRKVSSRQGVLTADNVVVRVGSEFDDIRDVVQRRLSTGARVQILSEKTLQTENGPQKMYKIAPPQGEYRWISGQAVIPANETARRRRDRNPYVTPSYVKREIEQSESGTSLFGDHGSRSATGQDRLVERPIVRTTDDSVIRRTAPDSDQVIANRRQLRLLDAGFREMIRNETSEWDFIELERDYHLLQETISHPALASQLDLRLDALKRYQQTKQEFDQFIQQASETDRRDARLASMQGQPHLQTAIQSDTTETEPQSGPVLYQPPPVPEPAPSIRPRLESTAPTSPATGRQTRSVPPMVGAGIVQRMATRHPLIPRHVLLAPDGRILAYLQSGPGINLDRHLGQSMGIYGRRSHRRDLRSDLIFVSGLAPVRLKQ